MAAPVNRKISAASARAHTRKSNHKSSFSLSSGLFKKILLVGIVGLLAWAYQATRPPPPKICGRPDGPPITATRIKLSDGRHLAYKEYGVPKEQANYKFIFVHGFDSCRLHASLLPAETLEGLGIYIVSFDRPGYGESDPHPNRTFKSIASDIEELADHLQLGEKFYVIGFSMGGQTLWSCLKYIPHRLAGATLISPVVNYWWSGLPANLSTEGLNSQISWDKWSLRVAHYAPWLTYWWNTQKLFPPLSVISQSPEMLSRHDKELIPNFPGKEVMAPVRQQGEFESLHRDLNVAFGKWDFDPTELTNPFPNNEGTVHLWHGDEDKIVPVAIQRYIVQKLPWIRYHEVSGAGHMFAYGEGMIETILKAQLSVET